MPNLFARLIPMLPSLKKGQPSAKHCARVKIQTRQKNNVMECIALMLLVVFFGCLGVASSGVPEMWTPSKVFFVAGFLLFIIGNLKKRYDLKSGKRGTDQECFQQRGELDDVKSSNDIIFDL